MDLRHVSERVRVVLDYAQEVEAHTVGFHRVTDINAVANHAARHNKNLNMHEYIAEMAESVGAEMVVAQYLGFKNFKPTLNTFKNEADVGTRFEVKWTKYKDGHLAIGETDRQQDVAILVVGKSPVYEIAGWIPVQMARKPKYLHQAYGCHWIPQNNLFPIQDIRNSIYGTD